MVYRHEFYEEYHQMDHLNNTMMAQDNTLSYSSSQKKGADMTQITSHRYNKKKDGKEIYCSICLSALKIGDEMIKLKCNHFFHKDCVIKWLKDNNNCPNCRRAVTT